MPEQLLLGFSTFEDYPNGFGAFGNHYAPSSPPFTRRYEQSWHKLNKTKLLQDALERSGRKDLADKLRCLHWGHQKLSRRVELPSAFPFLVTVYKTINNKEGFMKINELSRKYT